MQPACLRFRLPLLLYFRSYCGSALRTILPRLIKPRIWLALHLTDRSCMHSYLSIVLGTTISIHARFAHLLHILFNTTPPSRLHAHIFCCCLIHMYSLALWSVRIGCLTSALVCLYSSTYRQNPYIHLAHTVYSTSLSPPPRRRPCRLLWHASGVCTPPFSFTNAPRIPGFPYMYDCFRLCLL